MTPKISIIIPIYNAEPFLERCIESVLNQSFSDFELLLINDGSKDNSASICDNYALQDTRVKVIHQENAGVSAARNKGLENSLGEWIAFVDSDDWVEKNYLKNLFNAIEENVDLIIGGFLEIKDGNINKKKIENNQKIIQIKDKDLILKKYALFNFSYPVAKLFKSKIIKKNQISFFKIAIMYEDTIFLMNYIKYCHTIKLIKNCDYNYNLNQESLSSNLHNFYSEYFIAEKLLKISLDEYELNINDLKNGYYKLGERIGNSTNRAILSMLRKKHSRFEVIKNFKTIDEDCLQLYNHYTNPSNIFRKVIKFLIVKKFYNTCYYYSKVAYKFSK